jgi:hypothetical protein
MKTKPWLQTREALYRLFKYDRETGWFRYYGDGKVARFMRMGDAGLPEIKVEGYWMRTDIAAWLYCNTELVDALEHINGDLLDDRIDNLRIPDPI